MQSLKSIIDAMQPIDGGARADIPANWLQGRTAYGGLSAALALHVAQRADIDLPPLRSALVAFIGPLSGTVTIRASLLRRGRNAAFVQADITGEAGLGLRATFVFMAPIDSRVAHQVGSAPDFARPAPGEKTFFGLAAVPFTQNFEMLDCRDARVGPAEWLRWIRLREREGLDPAVELLAVADGLPPAALKLVGGPAPVSSMTWQVNLLAPPTTTDGWWLLRADSDYAHGGVSNQDMRIWNADGQPMAAQMQSVAIFA